MPGESVPGCGNLDRLLGGAPEPPAPTLAPSGFSCPTPTRSNPPPPALTKLLSRYLGGVEHQKAFLHFQAESAIEGILWYSATFHPNLKHTHTRVQKALTFLWLCLLRTLSLIPCLASCPSRAVLELLPKRHSHTAVVLAATHLSLF